ncbi:hypothetical protein HRbin28_00583 [bacterium HR28]|jgi:uncharacterized protein|uniref:DUF177 domain-containing protein n=1 Tax=Thermomicrobium roseum TaxID=500 RepID=A0A7C1XIZ6_THERO|nr:hypothetical protein HRbin28_00583 [bacterium HR28]
MRTRHLENDTIINVAQLLKAPVGTERFFTVHLDRLTLDSDLEVRDVNASVRLLRTSSGILATGELHVSAHLTCVRCLTEFDSRYSETFEAEYWPTIDVLTGLPLPPPEDEDIFTIDQNHHLDLHELLRQFAILALPSYPVCGPQCPGPESLWRQEEEIVDARLAVLQALLDERS